ncbi:MULTISPECIES: serine--tRNA ligase [unclassified Clostridioides]|uniref:serine--tRNA ligase n=1 Tax=unclassified Clostridioides TaxID=2635829 RepID=UPI001D0FE142|nr:serine--tRNA ligase [Clostridioides sp. ZZV14-6150]MCC0662371.1 serine--tRNA ligase [Clostridioides sp. ZZV14-6154]MCC0670328.1 serine--tRNA ligase [Clostridioides sp. ZZV14-6153]MCC0720668.1 serine--tRNA ligase [Clostridioides sp. ZZV14-6105]MCC0724658.1 serine--tRNA ligase [Clostridioides sp. ZZV14-6104]MCC0728877.1 serine--tRNA ligase [Clostridioides sp. ZZV14-6045]MCC0732893.1 serine--tRNA ligase [Clostridioides sp. ZZV14-6048]MCC0736825.1 serine--tRNA ligase [Clostridioides sp. ZZV14
MLDIKRIRENLDDIKKAMEIRGEKEFDLDAVVELDNKRREILQEVEVMKNELNVNSKKIPQLIKEGKDVEEEKARLKELSDKIKGIDEKVKEVEAKMEYALMRIPNVPHPDVPQGETDEDNVQVRTWGEPTKFDFEHKAHWDIGTGLGILDFETAGKITGSRFTLYRGLGARLERSLMNFFLNTHTAKHGYTEVLPPFMANRNSFIGTGQLPKFEEDMFKIEGLEYFLIPTAEVPVTNIHANEILDVAELPIKYCAYTPCFRSEAGSAGRDTRGLVRQHQFNKVELVKFVKPEDSYKELESLTHDAETMLQMLGLPYRVVRICTGDLGFTAAFKYDLEVWMPSYNRYVEISSCSNFEDFQARRAGIRFKRDKKSKAEYVHTLNGSGLAIGRCLAAILENYQQADGSVMVPEELRPYMGVDVIK